MSGARWSPSGEGDQGGPSLVSTALLASLIGLLSACSTSDRPGVVAAQPTVEQGGSLRLRLLVTGELAAASSLQVLAPRTRAWDAAIRWMIEDGAEVEEGEPLVELDNSSLAGRLEESRLAVGEAADELERLRLEIEAQTLEKEFEVERKRVDLEKASLEADVPESILARRELEEKRLARRRAEVELAKAEQGLTTFRRTAQADLELKRLDLQRSRRELEILQEGIEALVVRAPRAGVALVAEHPWEDRRLQVGDGAWPGMPLMFLPDLETLQVEAPLWDVDDGRLREGQEGTCRLDAYPDRTIPCQVERISPVARQADPDSERRSFDLVLKLAAVDRDRMRPGMSVQADIETGRLEGVPLIRRAALVERNGRLRLPVESDGRLPGPCSALDCAIPDGESPALDARASVVEGPRPIERAGSGLRVSEEQRAAPDRDELKRQVETLVESWVAAWEEGDLEAYLACYSPAFVPAGGLSRGEWQTQRARRLRGRAGIDLELGGLEVEILSPGSAAARFIQSYSSDTYRDRVRKQLDLELGGGAWRIVAERVLEELPAKPGAGERR